MVTQQIIGPFPRSIDWRQLICHHKIQQVNLDMTIRARDQGNIGKTRYNYQCSKLINKKEAGLRVDSSCMSQSIISQYMFLY